MRHPREIFLATTILIACHANAQTPALNAERAKLQFLVGSFATEARIPPGPPAPKGATGKGTTVATWALDSTFLFIDDETTNPLFGHYKGHAVLGFDAKAHDYVLSVFNNFGDYPVYRGNFVGDTLSLYTKVPMPPKPFDQRLLWYTEGEVVKMKILNDFGQGYVLAYDQSAIPVSGNTKR
jgi:hypothetical protein